MARGWQQLVPSGKKPPALHVALAFRHGSILDMAGDEKLRLVDSPQNGMALGTVVTVLGLP